MTDPMPESVRSYLETLIDAYSGEATPSMDVVAKAWDAVPLNWRMRIHEKCDHEDPAQILASAREMLGLDEVPELDESFFEKAVLTRPGEDVIEKVAPVTLESVQNWELEKLDTHTIAVPKMPQKEREAWHRLKDQEMQSQVGGPKLTREETKLLRALNRKVRRRAAFERIS